jgi:hypothetical protein
MMDYWIESVSQALDDLGVKLSDEQINEFAKSMECAHENYGMAFGHDTIPSPLQTELQEARRSFAQQFDKAEKDAETRENAYKRELSSRIPGLREEDIQVDSGRVVRRR